MTPRKSRRPWKSGSILETNFYFNPKDPAEEAYEQAVLAGTVAALEKVIEDHPESEFAEKARKRKEELQAREQPAQLIAQIIQSAVTQGVIQSAVTQGATQREVELIRTEQMFFDHAMKSRDPMNLQAYLEKSSNGEFAGKFAPIAENELRKLINKIADPSELQAFLNTYPESQFAGLARLRLKRSIENSTDPGRARDHIWQGFSDSEFVEPVRERLKQLDASTRDPSEGETAEPEAPEPQEEVSPEPALSGPNPELVEWSLGLDRAERRRIQQGLAAEGFDPGPIDGIFGKDTRDRIEEWQAAQCKPKTRHLHAESVKALFAAADEADTQQAASDLKAEAERRSAEDRYWNSIKNSEDPDDFDRYLADYPGGHYENQARKRRSELVHSRQTRRKAEDELWAKAERSRDPAQIDEYLANAYPQGRYVKQALRLKAKLLEARRAEDKLWNSVKNSRDPADFDRYLTAYPQRTLREAGPPAQGGAARSAKAGRQALGLRQEQPGPGRLRPVPHRLSAGTLREAGPPAQGGAARGAKGGRQTLELRQEQPGPGRLRPVPQCLSAGTLREAGPPAQGGAARGAKGGRQALELRQEQPGPGRLRPVPQCLSAGTLREAGPPAQGGAARGAKGGRRALERHQEQRGPGRLRPVPQCLSRKESTQRRHASAWRS